MARGELGKRILAQKRTKLIKVGCVEIGVREMSAAKALAMATVVAAGGKEEVGVEMLGRLVHDHPQLMRDIIVECTYEPGTEEPAFYEIDAEQISAEAFNTIFGEIQELSNARVEAEEVKI